MKRDMDLVKAIMLKIEDDIFNNQVDGYPDKEVFYHLKLLIDAKFIDGKYYYDTESNKRFVNGAIINDITWQGYDFLELLKDDKKFAYIKDIAKKIPLETIKIGMKLAAESFLGENPTDIK